MEDFITLLAILLPVLVFAIKSRGAPECVGLIGCAQACRLFLRQEDHSFRVLGEELPHCPEFLQRRSRLFTRLGSRSSLLASGRRTAQLLGAVIPWLARRLPLPGAAGAPVAGGRNAVESLERPVGVDQVGDTPLQ